MFFSQQTINPLNIGLACIAFGQQVLAQNTTTTHETSSFANTTSTDNITATTSHDPDHHALTHTIWMSANTALAVGAVLLGIGLCVVVRNMQRNGIVVAGENQRLIDPPRSISTV